MLDATRRQQQLVYSCHVGMSVARLLPIVWAATLYRCGPAVTLVHRRQRLPSGPAWSIEALSPWTGHG